MTTVLLLRHGRSTANAGGVLAGWTPDVHLHEDGEKQAQALAERLAKVPLKAVVSSPLDRCRETVAPLLPSATSSPPSTTASARCATATGPASS